MLLAPYRVTAYYRANPPCRPSLTSSAMNPHYPRRRRIHTKTLTINLDLYSLMPSSPLTLIHCLARRRPHHRPHYHGSATDRRRSGLEMNSVSRSEHESRGQTENHYLTGRGGRSHVHVIDFLFWIGPVQEGISGPLRLPQPITHTTTDTRYKSRW
jgi:hypothetical protein